MRDDASRVHHDDLVEESKSEIEIVHHVTPSPHTVFGQKGSGESGYLGAPAAISSAINDAVRPLGIRFEALPIRISAIGDAIAKAKGLP